MEANRKSLENAEVGDTLIISSWRANHFSKVTRVTKAYVYCGASRYNKKNGNCVGNNYYSAQVATEEEINAHEAEKKHKRLVSAVLKIDFIKVPDDCLEKVLAVVGEYQSC